MPYDSDYLQHHGILGQKWGIRRFQNPDGTLTEAGKKRYAKEVATYLSENSRDMERDRFGTYAVKLSTGNETVYNELVRSSKALKDSADNLRDKELEYDRVSMMYDKDDFLRKEFEDEVRKDEYYSKQIEEAIKKALAKTMFKNTYLM